MNAGHVRLCFLFIIHTKLECDYLFNCYFVKEYEIVVLLFVYLGCLLISRRIEKWRLTLTHSWSIVGKYLSSKASTKLGIAGEVSAIICREDVL